VRRFFRDRLHWTFALKWKLAPLNMLFNLSIDF
jgi:hypothetical protein